MTISGDASDAIVALDALIERIERLKKATTGGSGLNTVANAITKLNMALSQASFDPTKFQQLADSLAPLQSIQKATGLVSSINALKKLPEISAQLAQIDMGAFATQIQRVAVAMKPLADEMQKVSNGFSAFPIKIQRLIQSNSGLTASNVSLGKSYSLLRINIGSGLVKLTAMYIGISRLGRMISGWITDSNAYVENLNLFTVAMGDYAEEAKAYAKTVQDLMGINASTWMRQQGIFMTLLTGFGNTMEASALMSKNLTQLGYDISSFFNISVEDAMQKLQSAVAGELEPVRRLGYDLSQARMQMDARAIAVADAFENIDFTDAKLQTAADQMGIKVLVSTLTQSEKSLLRYLELMNQVTVVQGDMARTLESPANQVRVLKANFELLSIELGNIFIPLLNSIIPSAIATTMVLRQLASEVASFFGYALPEFDYSSVKAMSSTVDEITEGFEASTVAAKELQKATAGFDELNILSEGSSSAGATATSLFAEALRNLKLPEYDFMGDLVESRASKLAKEFYEPMKRTLQLALAIGTTIAAWKIAQNVLDFFHFITINPVTASVALLLSVVSIAFTEGVFKDFTMQKSFKIIMPALLGALVGFAFFNAPGAIIGFSLGASIGLGYLIFENKLEDKSNANQLFWSVMAGMLGAVIGLAFGGIPGAILGLTVGSLLTFETMEFIEDLKGILTIRSLWNAVLEGMLLAIIGGAFGWLILGPLGAAIGASIGLSLGVKLSIGNVEYEGSIPAPPVSKVPRSTPLPVYQDVNVHASGGIIEDGLFTMNQGEIAGRFLNGKSVVANNEQIVEGISAGVYEAVVAAMSQSPNNGGTQEFNLIVNGKEMTKEVEKVQRERGLTLVGSQLGGRL